MNEEKTCNACDGRGWTSKMVMNPMTGGDGTQDMKCLECNGTGIYKDVSLWMPKQGVITNRG